MIDLESYMIDALATAVEGAAAAAALALNVRRGWIVDATGDASDLFKTATVALVPGVSDTEEDAVLLRTEAADDPANVRMIWRRERVELSCDVWIYTSDKTAREAVLSCLQTVLYPYDDGEPRDCMLTLRDGVNHGAGARVLPGQREVRDAESVAQGYATMRWPVTLVASRLDATERASSTRSHTEE